MKGELMMHEVHSATAVRNNWGQFIDDVIRKGPQFVKRNRDEWAALSSEHLRAAFESFQFEAELLKEVDGSTTAVIKGFDIVSNGENEEKALDELTELLIDYAKVYRADFELYYRSPNRRAHFPYIMNVLIQENREEVRKLIQCQVGEK